MVNRLHVKVKGRVQGVGFRYSTYYKAQELGLNGWVQNLYDGRSVEAVFEGPKETLEEMALWCQSGPPMARVLDIDVNWETGGELYTGFHIR